MNEDSPQRDYPKREVLNNVRWLVRAGVSWRRMPHDLPPLLVVYKQTQRWLKASVFESLAHGLRAILRLAQGRTEEPSAMIFDSRTLQSTPESGGRTGYDGAKRRQDSQVHLAVDLIGHLLVLQVTTASEQDQVQVGELCE